MIDKNKTHYSYSSAECTQEPTLIFGTVTCFAVIVALYLNSTYLMKLLTISPSFLLARLNFSLLAGMVVLPYIQREVIYLVWINAVLFKSD